MALPRVCDPRQTVLLKVKGLDTCYRATYTSQTQEQQHFTLSEVAADCHELTISSSSSLLLITVFLLLHSVES